MSAALYAARFRDLAEIGPLTYVLAGKEHTSKPRRVWEDETEVFVFVEQWASTALGYGGMGGCMITEAYTVIVAAGVVGEACVYWGPGGMLGRKMSYRDGRAMAHKLTSR